MKHHLRIARYTIIGGTVLFLMVALMFLQGDFAGKATTGNMGSNVRIVNSTPVECTFYAEVGYNLVSVWCLHTAVPITDVIDNLTVQAMYQYVPGDVDGWRVYNPNLPSYVVSDLQYMTRRAGYVAIMDAPTNKTFQGLRAASTDIPLFGGWNLVGYPSNITRSSFDAFSSVNSSVDLVIAYNKTGEAFINYTVPDGSGDLQNIERRNGYWVNTTAATNWVVNS
jgi:hypothetical protein